LNDYSFFSAPQLKRGPLGGDDQPGLFCMSRRDAGNWVDRGQPPEPELNRVLAIYLEKDPERDGVALRTYVSAIKDMVEAGTSAADVAGYLRHIEGELGIAQQEGRVRALASVALWHVVQAARVRGAAT
jgi:hypothetical protein